MNRPLDEGLETARSIRVLFIDAIVVKVRYWQVRNKPIYVVRIVGLAEVLSR
jgi:hypothetical protein